MLFSPTVLRVGVIGSVAVCFASIAQADIHINEVAMTDGSPQWIELYNAGRDPISLTDHIITNEREVDALVGVSIVGIRYEIPATLPDVPPGAFVVIYFDGQGAASDEYDFGDNKAILHSEPGEEDPFDLGGDHAALYSSDVFEAASILSFVAWGVAPGDAAAFAVEESLWPGDQAAIQFVGPGGGEDDSPPGPGEITMDTGGTIGSTNNVAAPHTLMWSVYPSATTTPGNLNALPGLTLYLPADGMGTGTGDVSFSWLADNPNATFHFQLASDAGFGAILVDEPALSEPAYDTVAPLAEGTYFWRVRIVEGMRDPGPWSPVRSFEIESFVEDPQEEFEYIPDRPVDGARGNNGGRRGQPDFADEANPDGGNALLAGNITGTIRDARTGRPLSGVTVTFTPGPLSAVTNASGVYTLNNVPNAMYNASATLENYNTLAGNVNVTGNATLNCSLMGKSHYAVRNGNSVTPRKARKDTRMLCVDGTAYSVLGIGFLTNLRSRCNELSTTVHLGEDKHHWDGTHYDRARWGRHEANHCPYAMTQMLNWYYGGTLTQDEISNWISVNDGTGNPWGFTTNPERGLRHDLGGWADTAVIWAINGGAINQKWTKPTEAEIMAFIDANRPCGFVQCNTRNGAGTCLSSHYMVLDGYFWADKRMYVRFLNTDNNGSVDAARRYNTQDFHSDPSMQAQNHRAGLVVPIAAATGRATDPRIALDSDGDCLVDFDEETRFFTNKNNKDTDADRVDDKYEIKSYIFPSPVRAISILQLVRPERLADSDGDGCKDGDEDVNRDGKYQQAQGESDPYNSASKLKPGDLNDDCLIDATDFNIFWQVFGLSQGDDGFLRQTDYNANGQTDLEDYQIWYGYFLQFNNATSPPCS